MIKAHPCAPDYIDIARNVSHEKIYNGISVARFVNLNILNSSVFSEKYCSILKSDKSRGKYKILRVDILILNVNFLQIPLILCFFLLFKNIYYSLFLFREINFIFIYREIKLIAT